jgi:hypothetical protein
MATPFIQHIHKEITLTKKQSMQQKNKDAIEPTA